MADKIKCQIRDCPTLKAAINKAPMVMAGRRLSEGQRKRVLQGLAFII